MEVKSCVTSSTFDQSLMSYMSYQKFFVLSNNVFCESAWACLIEYWIKCYYHFYTQKDSLSSNDLWKKRSSALTALTLGIACCKTTPSHYLMQYRLETNFTISLVTTKSSKEMSNVRLPVHLSITRLSQQRRFIIFIMTSIVNHRFIYVV